ncbi:hypothetical protein Y032_0096g2894 [Ancylostoma ceylanicum]|uniref:Uncharacterized protein n=1 Tax=Ancylostoma ceylanicum TaxID=53326 RepID=A0A016TJ65_9BILA|nr:hypothetical protein Y032_0096g2894 [Ancylostoma ceylanicum]
MSRLFILLAFLVLSAQGLTGDSVGAGALGRRRRRSLTSEEELTKSKECYLPQRRHERLFVRFVDYSHTAPSSGVP